MLGLTLNPSGRPLPESVASSAALRSEPARAHTTHTRTTEGDHWFSAYPLHACIACHCTLRVDTHTHTDAVGHGESFTHHNATPESLESPTNRVQQTQPPKHNQLGVPPPPPLRSVPQRICTLPTTPPPQTLPSPPPFNTLPAPQKPNPNPYQPTPPHPPDTHTHL